MAGVRRMSRLERAWKLGRGPALAEVVKEFPSCLRRGLKPLCLQGVVDRADSRFAPMFTRSCYPPKPRRASSPSKIGGEFFTPPLRRKGTRGFAELSKLWT